jgi:uncharacterized protein (DUF362 family)
MTGVLKNSLGLLPDADISFFHPYLPVLISRLHMLCPPDLCIIDGRIGLEGKGPIMGDPVCMDTLIVGADALVTDEVASLLMGIQPASVPHLRQVAKDLNRSLGQFEIVGHLHPRTFAFDAAAAFPSILAKFANRRLHRNMEDFSRLWIDRAFRLKEDPHSFARSAIKKLVKGRRES